MADWETKEYLELLEKYPPFDQCEDWYDFYDHVLAVCKDLKVCLDEDGEILEMDFEDIVKALLALPDGWEEKR